MGIGWVVAGGWGNRERGIGGKGSCGNMDEGRRGGGGGGGGGGLGLPEWKIERGWNILSSWWDWLLLGNRDNDVDDDDNDGDIDDGDGNLEWDAKLMARDVEIVIGGVREVRSVVVLNHSSLLKHWWKFRCVRDISLVYQWNWSTRWWWCHGNYDDVSMMIMIKSD